MAALSTYTPIATQTLSSTSTQITFDSIPLTYTDLFVACNLKSNSGNLTFQIKLNNDSSSLYSYTRMSGTSGVAVTDRQTSQTYFVAGWNGSSQYNEFSTLNFNLFSYANTSTFKTVVFNLAEAALEVTKTVGTYRSTNAITRIDLIAGSSAIAIGSTFSLYGIANNTAGAKATGGVISSDSSYFYHSFYATGTFTPSSALTGADVLVVGGGGGASSGSAAGMGGGGAGGYRALASQSFASGTAYTCTVGSGGAGASYAAAGGTGTGSSLAGTGFTTISASAGGAGSAYGATGSNGGSGGGGSGTGTFAGGSGNSGGYSPVEGYAGGGGRQSGAYYTGGGGGGASAVGADATSGSLGGNGGAGTQWYNGNYYAGGGGGGNNQVAAIATGGSSIGGNGGLASSTAATNGVINTGSGGGGGAGLAGAAGGSGVVIIRYAR
jgi:hypothetical protein